MSDRVLRTASDDKTCLSGNNGHTPPFASVDAATLAERQVIFKAHNCRYKSTVSSTDVPRGKHYNTAVAVRMMRLCDSSCLTFFSISRYANAKFRNAVTFSDWKTALWKDVYSLAAMSLTIFCTWNRRLQIDSNFEFANIQFRIYTSA